MIDLTTQKEAATKAARGMSDNTVEFAGKAKDLGVSSARTANDSATDYLEKATDFGLQAADAALEAFKVLVDRAMSLTDRGIEKVGDVQVGQKNVGERVQATVDTVEERIDVDQLQDQVAKLRDQMEHVLVSWKDSFRPSATVTEVVVEKTVPAKKAPTAKKTAPKKGASAKAKTTAKKTPSTKAATKK
jgi:hypothetical protein